MAAPAARVAAPPGGPSAREAASRQEAGATHPDVPYAGPSFRRAKLGSAAPAHLGHLIGQVPQGGGNLFLRLNAGRHVVAEEMENLVCRFLVRGDNSTHQPSEDSNDGDECKKGSPRYA
ncbi:MAG: hypothetical protein QXG97_06870 [Nitrososphaerota archaeon]